MEKIRFVPLFNTKIFWNSVSPEKSGEIELKFEIFRHKILNIISLMVRLKF